VKSQAFRGMASRYFALYRETAARGNTQILLTNPQTSANKRLRGICNYGIIVVIIA
jgi:hypothetical protein